MKCACVFFPKQITPESILRASRWISCNVPDISSTGSNETLCGHQWGPSFSWGVMGAGRWWWWWWYHSCRIPMGLVYIYIHIFTHMNGCFWLVKCIGSRYTIHMDPPQTWALQKLTGILLLFAVVSCRNPIIRYFPRSCWRKLDENRHKKDDSAQKNDSMSV